MQSSKATALKSTSFTIMETNIWSGLFMTGSNATSEDWDLARICNLVHGYAFQNTDCGSVAR